MQATNAFHPPNWIPVRETPIFTPRKLRVVSVGAGFANLTLAYKISHELKVEDWVQHVIYEKNHDIGGTWLENRYPGVACDVPAHVYTFTFEPNPDWTRFYASGLEIWEYMKRAAKKWDLDKNVVLNSRIVSSIWNEETGKWELKIQQKDGIITDTCDVLVNGSGILNNWKWPKIPGLNDFKGHLVHSAAWDSNYDFRAKKVAVIGNGSSAIQIIPEIQKLASHLTNLMRSPTWVSPNLNEKFTRNGDGKNFYYTDEEKKKYREDPQAHFEYRASIEGSFNKFFWGLITDSKEQLKMQAQSKDLMESALHHNSELISRFVPDWKVGCRRLTPGEGYLAALQEPNVDALFTEITKVTENSIVLEDGHVIEVDAIICATGFDVSFAPYWEVKGRNGVDLMEEWKDNPAAYLGICAPNIPNYFLFNGPNCPIGHGSVIAALDFSASYMMQWIRKIATEDIRSLVVKNNVVNDYNVYTQEFLKRTVWATGCRSWYKNGKVDGKITALYGGSIPHYYQMLKSIRGEDFEIDYNSKNRFKFMGNGFTAEEESGNPDMAFYLHP